MNGWLAGPPFHVYECTSDDDLRVVNEWMTRHSASSLRARMDDDRVAHPYIHAQAPTCLSPVP